LTSREYYTKIRIMSESSEWTVVFYVEDSGRMPVQEFLDGLDLKTRLRLLASIERLRTLNVQAREPLVRHLEDKIWELRQESNTTIYCLPYFFFSGRRIVLLHGFQKKTQKTPRGEIETATRRLRSYVSREGGEAS
jgi:phage-related protein